jgi:hypothetical protein
MWNQSTRFRGIALWDIFEDNSERLLKARVQIDHSHLSEGGMGTIDPHVI